MNDNTIKTLDGIEVYEDKIYYYADQYINSLIDPQDIYNSNTFNAMINYIYKKVFKPDKNQKVYNNTNSNLNLSDIDLLDNIFNILAELCGKYKKHITLLMFSNLIGIDNNTIENWIKGNSRNSNNNNAEASSAHFTTAKKWKTYCEQNLLAGAVDNNSVGCIFALKANYGYSDQPVQKIEITNGKSDPGEIAADIAARHIESTPEKPPLLGDIDISDN